MKYVWGLSLRLHPLQSEPIELSVSTADGTAPLFSGNPCASVGNEVCTSDLTSYIGLHSIFPYSYDTSTTGLSLAVSVTEDSSKVGFFRPYLVYIRTANVVLGVNTRLSVLCPRPCLRPLKEKCEKLESRNAFLESEYEKYVGLDNKRIS